MTSPIVKLHDAFQKDAKEVLTEAVEMDFETVVIVGITKQKNVFLKASRNVNTLQLLGALEAAKMHVNTHWEDA